MNDRLAQARASALAELRATPKLSPWWLGAIGLIGLELVLGLGLGLFTLGGIGNRVDPSRLWSLAALLGGSITLSVLAGLAPAGMRWRGWAIVTLSTLVAVVMGGSGIPSGRSLLGGMWGCGKAEILISLLPAAVALFLLTRFAASRRRTLQVAASAAGAGLLMLHLHCPDGTAAHLLTGHVLPAAVIVSLVVWLRPRLSSHSHAP